MPPESRKPGPVGAGRRLETDTLLRKQSTPSASPSTRRIVQQFLNAAAAAEVVRAARIRERMRDLRQQHRESLARLDVIADELAGTRRKACP